MEDVTRETVVIRYDPTPKPIRDVRSGTIRYFTMNGNQRAAWREQAWCLPFWNTVHYGPYDYGLLSPVSLPNYLEFKSSRNTTDWPGTKGARVAGLALTKSGQAISRPKKPEYRPPRLKNRPKDRKIPVAYLPPARPRGPRQSATSYDNYVVSRTKRLTKKYETLVIRLVAANKRRSLAYDDYLLSYQKRLAEYKEVYFGRLNKYRFLLEKYSKALSEAGKPRFRKGVCYVNPKLPQDNPYQHLTLIPSNNGEDLRSVWTSTANGFALGFSYPPGEMFDGLHDHIGPWGQYENALISDPQFLRKVQGQISAAADKVLVPLDQRLIRKLRSKLKNGAVHVGNLMAERKQTFDMLRDLFKRILKLVSLKRAVLQAALGYARNPKKIANDVLAFKFGIEPLVNDVMNLIEFLDETHDTALVIARTNAGTSVTETLVFETEEFSFAGFVEMSYVAKCSATNVSGRTASQFGMVNPLEIAWEVMPWSFVVDWVYPVGQWISSLTDDFGLDFITGTRKVKLKGTFELKATPVVLTTDPGYATQSSRSALGKFDGVCIYRTVLTELPVHTIPLKNPWSWSHGVESIALLVQRLKGST